MSRTNRNPLFAGLYAWVSGSRVTSWVSHAAVTLGFLWWFGNPVEIVSFYLVREAVQAGLHRLRHEPIDWVDAAGDALAPVLAALGWQLWPW